MLTISFDYRPGAEPFASGHALLRVDTDDPREALRLALEQLAARKPRDVSRVIVSDESGKPLNEAFEEVARFPFRERERFEAAVTLLWKAGIPSQTGSRGGLLATKVLSVPFSRAEDARAVLEKQG